MPYSQPDNGIGGYRNFEMEWQEFDPKKLETITYIDASNSGWGATQINHSK